MKFIKGEEGLNRRILFGIYFLIMLVLTKGHVPAAAGVNDIWCIQTKILTMQSSFIVMAREGQIYSIDGEEKDSSPFSTGTEAVPRIEQILGHQDRQQTVSMRSVAEGDILWMQIYGGSKSDAVYSVIQTVDGGFALAGNTISFGAGKSDAWLVKTDINGAAQWNQTYGGASGESAYSVIQTSDGGFALAGNTISYGAGDWDFWLVKINARGKVQWTQTYGGSEVDVAHMVIQTVDGGFALLGYTQSSGAGEADFWLVKTDVNGVTQWTQTYGGTFDDFGHTVIQTPDGGFALAGRTSSFGAFGDHFWLVKTNSNGVAQWNRTYVGFPPTWGANAAIQTTDGGFALVGDTFSYDSASDDFWLVKTDDSGEVKWTQTYGGPKSDSANSVIQTVDGGFALVGETYSFGAGWTDAWLVKTDAYGVAQWNQTYGGDKWDEAFSVIQTSDGGFALVVVTGLLVSRNPDAWLVKTVPPDATADTDGDGLTNGEEVNTHGTNPMSADTDGDGLTDAEEVRKYYTNPINSDTDADTDGDGLTNIEEVDIYHTNPQVQDTAVDTDGDGLPNVEEVDKYGTSPTAADTDSDGLSDGEEIATHGTSPISFDTDGDSLGDGHEIQNGTDPLNRDSDHDLFGDSLDPFPTFNNFYVILPSLGILGVAFQIRARRKRRARLRGLPADLGFYLIGPETAHLKKGSILTCTGGKQLLLIGEVFATGELDLFNFTINLELPPAIHASPPNAIKRLGRKHKAFTLQFLPKAVGLHRIGLLFSWKHPITRQEHTKRFSFSIEVKPGILAEIITTPAEVGIGEQFPVRVSLKALLDTEIQTYQLLVPEGFKVRDPAQLPERLRAGDEWIGTFGVGALTFGEFSLVFEVRPENYIIRSEPKSVRVLPKRPQVVASTLEVRDEVELGGEVILAVNFLNEGLGDARNIHLPLPLPAALEAINEPELKLPELKVGEAVKQELTVKVVKSGEVMIPVTTVYFEDQMGNTFTYGLAGWTFRVAKKLPGMRLVFSTPKEVQVGTEFETILRVSNEGEGIAENVIINIAPPEGMHIVQGARRHNLGTIPPRSPRNIFSIVFLAEKPGTYAFDKIGLNFEDVEGQEYRKMIPDVTISVVEAPVEQVEVRERVMIAGLVKEAQPTILESGLAAEKIDVEEVLRILKQLANVYDRVAWQTLMNVFRLEHEEDLKALLFQVGLLGELEIKMDELDKSVRLTVVEKIADLKPRKLHCPTCGAALEPQESQCPTCRDEFPICVICRQPILESLTKTPCCGTYSHAPHLQEWLRIKGTCPICREKIKEWMIP